MSRAFGLLRRRTSVVLSLVVVLGGAPLEGAGLFDPALRFRTLTTEHFVIYFHQGEERLAGRLASIAEEIWEVPPIAPVRRPSRTHVVLVDQTDMANGWATPLPYNTIVISAAWPAGFDLMGHTDDWLRLVLTHEFAHVVHLDRSAGWARFVRGAFGRVVLAFPNLLLPAWQIEGLATYEESVLTGFGRLHASDFRTIEVAPGRQGTRVPLDRVNGGLTDWPGGAAPYVYGLGFHAYLAERFGADRLPVLAEATARSLPFAGSRAFRRVFGQSLGDLWQDYQNSLTANASRPAPENLATRITRHGFTTTAPRFAPPVCDGCSEDIVYSARTPYEFPAIHAVARDGGSTERLVTRHLGSTLALSGDILVFDEQDLHRAVALYSDLHILERTTGRTYALTSGARLSDPDISPDGRTIVCVRQQPGQRDMVLLTLRSTPDGRLIADSIVPLISATDTQFNTPRWSPDGRSIVAGRHRLGALPEIVVVETESRAVHVAASSVKARIVTPTWRPDGRAIVASADFGGSFNLYEFEFEGTGFRSAVARQLTFVTGGATWPDVSRDRRTLAYLGYTPDGFDVFTTPYPAPSQDRAEVTDLPPPRDAPSPPSPSYTAGTPKAYSPWPTLGPTSWTPVLGSEGDRIRFGAATGGSDILQYHAYRAEATWIAGNDDGDPANRRRAVPDWNVAYAYQRWRPTFFTSLSSTTSFLEGPPSASGAPSPGTVGETAFEAGLQIPFHRVRLSHQGVLSVRREVNEYTLPDESGSLQERVIRAGWAVTSAQQYGFSISPERGFTAGATAEWAKLGPGASGDATTLTADARAYLPGVGRNHVVAVRVAGGASTGEARTRRVFHLGGADSASSVIDFGRDAFSLLRGFPADSYAGHQVMNANVDYRWPLARPQRGAGTWPMFLHTVHAALFADAGHAWTETFRAGDVKASAGGELAVDLVAGYSYPLTVTFGVAWGRDGARFLPDAARWYVRIGSAF
jgi:hypothetical protein